MLWRGSFEYIMRGMRMPLAIMAVSAVPKTTAPFYRLVTDARPVNVFADKWNVKYISIKTLRLILGPKSLFWTVKYGMGSRKHLAPNRWKRARKGLLQKERWDSCRES